MSANCDRMALARRLAVLSVLGLGLAGCGEEETVIAGPGARAASSAVADDAPLVPGALYEVSRPGALWYRMEPDYQQAVADRAAGTPAWEGDATRKGNLNIQALPPGTQFRINQAVAGGAQIMIKNGRDIGHAGWIERASIPAQSIGQDPLWTGPNALPGGPGGVPAGGGAPPLPPSPPAPASGASRR